MHLSGIDANLLIALDALLRETSVTRAAARVGLSQSAMSHALGRLRSHLGDPLLVRAGRTMVLTPRARALIPRVRKVVEDMERIFAPEEGFDPATLRRAYRVPTSDHVEFLLLPALDRILADEAPRLDLHIAAIAADTPDVIRDGGADAAIGVFSGLPPDIHDQPLFADRLVCVLRRDHPALDTKLTIERYAALPHLLVAPRGKPRGVVDSALADRGLERRVARSVPHFLMAPFLAATSDCVLTISERLARHMAALLPLEICEPPVRLEPYTLSLIWHERDSRDAAHRWLREAVVRAASGLDGPAGNIHPVHLSHT